MAKNRPDIFKILSHVDNMDKDAFEEIEREFSPFMTMKWMASCKDPNRIVAVNELLNLTVFNLHREKRLLYYLCCCISDGEKKRYNWIPRYKDKDKAKIEIMSKYFGISYKEARTGTWKYNTDDIVEMAEELGYDNSEIKKIKNKIK